MAPVSVAVIYLQGKKCPKLGVAQPRVITLQVDSVQKNKKPIRLIRSIRLQILASESSGQI